MLPRSLNEWLAFIERGHPQTIALGLDRVCAVRDALGLKPRFPVITVGGTNGKGSACMMLEAMLDHAGYTTGCYTSPHLLRYNERVRVGRAMAADEALADAFEAVEAARAKTGVALTYFEAGTLAALRVFDEARIDAAILEVGLGGRLDAVNAFDADCAMVMSVAMDHMDYLGDTREKIGYEKAGIFRAGRPAICGDADPPVALVQHAAAVGAPLQVRGRDFSAELLGTQGMQWRYRGPGGARHGLPWPALRGASQLHNAAACIAALDTLRDRLPVTMDDIRTGLLTVENPGRFQVLPGRPQVILDVAHNPHAAAALAEGLKGLPRGGRVLAVFGMLADKDIAGVVRLLQPYVDAWYAAALEGPRGTSAEHIAGVLAEAGIETVIPCPHVRAACMAARAAASADDKILIFGSFHTVGVAMQAMEAGLLPRS